MLIVATVVFRAKSARAYAEAREKVSVVNADLAENVSGLRVAQAYRREQVNRDRFGGLSSAYRRSRLRAQRYIAVYFPFVQALSTIAGALVLFVAAGEVQHRDPDRGRPDRLPAVHRLAVLAGAAAVPGVRRLPAGRVGLHRIKDLLRTPTSTPAAGPPGGAGPPARRDRAARRPLRLHGASPEAIGGVSLSVAPGETVALVGQTGAGKSTVVKLVARFYDATSGQRAGRRHRRPRRSTSARYRQQLGVVPQETYLFAGTVRDAIAYGRPEATDAEVEAAARGVGAIDMIARLAGGFAHPVTERGRNLAAGQRQLIALARAYLVDPAILLLDEATAALDLAAEAEVNRATEQLAAHGAPRWWWRTG